MEMLRGGLRQAEDRMARAGMTKDGRLWCSSYRLCIDGQERGLALTTDRAIRTYGELSTTDVFDADIPLRSTTTASPPGHL